MKAALRTRLEQMAAVALAKADGDLPTARKILKRRLLADQSLLSAVLDEVIMDAVELCVGVTHRQANQAAFAAATPTVRTRTQQQMEITQTALRTLLLDVVLGVSGVRLRAARRPDLRQEATFHQKQARTMTVKAAFFTCIAARLPDDKTSVEKVLTEHDLRALFEEARCAGVSA